MICVYPADAIDFSTNGNGVLTPLTAQVTETLNGEYELQLVPGSKLFLYTDGVPEAMGGKTGSEMFGPDRMLNALNENAEASPKELLLQVRRAVDSFVRDAERFDDMTMLCMEYKGKVP